MSEAATPPPPQSSEAELIAIRREKLAKLRELGIDPYGSRFAVSTTPGELRASFTEGQQVKIAGRIIGLRDMGKSVFFQLGDVLGSIQGYLGIKHLSDEQAAAWKCLDRGDWIGIEGETFLTRTGEPTVKVADFTVLSKALRPMPDKFHGLADRETKYRKRHLDLMGNPDSATLFVTRSLMLAEIRRFLQERGFLEVETPMLQDIPGGAAARPFETFHNALGMPLTLRIAPELFLKRLLVGGFTKIFELNRNFRNEGISRRHNPEFTMLEAYWAFSDFEEMANLVEELTCHLAQKFCGGLKIEHKDDEGLVTRTIDLTRPWRRANYHDLIMGVAGADFFELSPAQRARNATSSACRFPRKWRTSRSSNRCSKKRSRNTPSTPASSPASPANSCRWPKSPPAAKPSRSMNSSSTARKSPQATRNSTTRTSSASASNTRPAARKNKKSTTISSRPLNTACLPPAASASASTAWS